MVEVGDLLAQVVVLEQRPGRAGRPSASGRCRAAAPRCAVVRYAPCCPLAIGRRAGRRAGRGTGLRGALLRPWAAAARAGVVGSSSGRRGAARRAGHLRRQRVGRPSLTASSTTSLTTWAGLLESTERTPPWSAYEQAIALLPLVRGSKHDRCRRTGDFTDARAGGDAETDERRYRSTLGSARRVVTNHHPSPFHGRPSRPARVGRRPGRRRRPGRIPGVAQAANPYERGPAPTAAILEASRGPFATSSQNVSSLVYGFGGGVIYYPTSTSAGTFGAIAISPGYTASWSSISWLGPRIASHGFVVIGIETNSRFDQPDSRGRQLLAALDYLTERSSVRTRIDSTRLAVAGHSMGGGGTLEAAWRGRRCRPRCRWRRGTWTRAGPSCGCPR